MEMVLAMDEAPTLQNPVISIFLNFISGPNKKERTVLPEKSTNRGGQDEPGHYYGRREGETDEMVRPTRLALRRVAHRPHL